MYEETTLKLLKLDVMVATDRMDDYLRHLILTAREFIGREGIALTDSAEDMQLVVMYAAYLYRRRSLVANTSYAGAMPRMLRWALNNRLLSEKAGAAIE